MTQTDAQPARTILVIGATGNQGGGLVGHLLASKDWHARGMTRTPDSDAARALAARGVEVVAGDMDDSTTLDTAMQGAYGVFSVQGEAPEDDKMHEAPARYRSSGRGPSRRRQPPCLHVIMRGEGAGQGRELLGRQTRRCRAHPGDWHPAHDHPPRVIQGELCGESRGD